VGKCQILKNGVAKPLVRQNFSGNTHSKPKYSSWEQLLVPDFFGILFIRPVLPSF
jgi:hypothetical protein